MTYGRQKYYVNYGDQNSAYWRVQTLARTGRPTNCPKPYRIVARISEQQKQFLEEFCKEQKCNTMQAIRIAIDNLMGTKK